MVNLLLLCGYFCLCFVFLFVFAELLCLAIRKQWWCVETARPCCANQPVVVQDSLKDALSVERVTDRFTYVPALRV